MAQPARRWRLMIGLGLIVLFGTVPLSVVPAQSQGFLRSSSQQQSKPKNLAQNWSTRVQETPKRRHLIIGSGTYRTLCVRVCDGYYFPISFKATRAKLRTDAVACLQRCAGGEARLFFHRNPGQDVNGAVDLYGNRYVNLENAYRYRKERVNGCDCKPAPWAETDAEVR